MMNKKMQKTLAVLAMVGFMGTTSLVNVSEAAMPTPPNAQQQQVNRPSQPQQPGNSSHNNMSMNRDGQPGNRPNGQPGNRPNGQPGGRNDRPEIRRMSAPRRDQGPRFDRDRESHSDTGNLVTGLIIGGILGAVIAGNSK